jgi:hypothetical protein
MAVGPRQQRIGNLPVAGEQNSAQPSADITKQVSSTKRQAEAAGNRRATADVFGRPQGGASFEWDAGLAINDVEGGGSS